MYIPVVRFLPEDGPRVRSVLGVFEGKAVKVAENPSDRFSTFLDALKAAKGRASLHMEASVYLAPDFKQVVDREVAEKPDKVIQFFSMRKDDVEKGSRYDSSFMMTSCFYLPEGKAEELYEYTVAWKTEPQHKDNPHYDEAIASWIKYTKEKYWICCPNPVDRVTDTKWISKTFKGERK
jgi:hypothetical protein